MEFSRGWWSFDLGRYRLCDDTYQLFPYESLPPLRTEQLDGTLRWLKAPVVAPVPPTPAVPPIVAKEVEEDWEELEDLEDDDDLDLEDWEEDDGDDDDYEEDGPYSEEYEEPVGDPVPSLLADVAAKKLTLPPVFVRFLEDKELQDAVPSCTACEWDVSPALIPSVVDPGAWFIRFLRDQQDCLFWYLYLTRDGQHCVVCSPIPIGQMRVSRKVVIRNCTWVAPTFENFLYRWWLENVLWDKLGVKNPVLNEEETAYLQHYLKK